MTGTRFFYLAEPIDQAGGNGKVSPWASVVLQRLSLAGVGAFLPKSAFSFPEGARESQYVRKVNHQAIAQSSGLIAILPVGVPTIGVPMEIEAAWQQGIPVLVITNGPTWSLDKPGIEIVDLRGLVLAGDVNRQIEAGVEKIVLADYSREQRRRPLPFQALRPEGQLPTRAHEDDAGLDLFVSANIYIEVDQFVDVPCAVAVQLESHHWGLIVGRSSTLRKRELMVTPGVIDPGYRGELFAGVLNMGNKSIFLREGERIAQFIVLGNATQTLVPVLTEQLRPSSRGTNGFGSSGT